RVSLQRRQTEAQASIARLAHDQRTADERLTGAQRRLFEAREATDDLSRRAADAGASHAALVERAAAMDIEVQRLEEAAAVLEERAGTLSAEMDTTRCRIAELSATIVAGEAQLHDAVRLLEALRAAVQGADEAVDERRVAEGNHELSIKQARGALESIRAAVAEL